MGSLSAGSVTQLRIKVTSFTHHSVMTEKNGIKGDWEYESQLESMVAVTLSSKLSSVSQAIYNSEMIAIYGKCYSIYH
jgi:hypothetical protein